MCQPSASGMITSPTKSNELTKRRVTKREILLIPFDSLTVKVGLKIFHEDANLSPEAHQILYARLGYRGAIVLNQQNETTAIVGLAVKGLSTMLTVGAAR